jgi:hypothetical protein
MPLILRRYREYRRDYTTTECGWWGWKGPNCQPPTQSSNRSPPSESGTEFFAAETGRVKTAFSSRGDRYGDEDGLEKPAFRGTNARVSGGVRYYFCSPQHTDSAFYPIISQMERAAGHAHDDTAQAKLDKLDTLLAQSLAPRQDVALLAEMLSLPNDGRYPTLELAPHQRRQRTLEALTTQIEALARRSPVLMIFEDAHWADPTSLEALGRSVDRIRALGVLLIVTYRPEFEPPWIDQPHVTTFIKTKQMNSRHQKTWWRVATRGRLFLGADRHLSCRSTQDTSCGVARI